MSLEVALENAIKDAKAGGRRDPSQGNLPPFSWKKKGNMIKVEHIVLRLKTEVPNVHRLELEENGFSTIPASLAELPRLRSLSLRDNGIEVFPDVLLQMTKLQELNLSKNNLKSIPEAISALRHLKVLDISDMKGQELTTLPNGICDLTALTRLNCEDCGLETLPEDFGELTSLVSLNLTNNRLVRLPESMGALVSLQTCHLSRNNLQRIPPSMGFIPGLRDFPIDQNNLPEAYHAASGSGPQGLASMMAFLQKEEKRERQEEIERMKPVGKESGPYMEYKLRINESRRVRQTRYVSRRERAAMAEAYNAFGAQDNRCFVRQGAAVIANKKYLTLVGGQEIKSASKTNNLYLLNLETLSFNMIITQGEAPPPRDGHSIICDEARNQLVLFGGRDAKGKRLNDVWTIDLETFMWQKRVTEGPAPGIRENASAAYMPDTHCMVIFGGKGSPKPYNDLYMLDLNTFTWFKPGSAGPRPPPRQSAAIAVSGRYIFIHGGRSNFVQDDLYAYDTTTGNWINIETTGRPGAQRHKHMMVAHEANLYIFGGFDDMGGLCAQLHRLQIPEEMSTEFLMRNPPEYTEMDACLEVKRHRFAVFANGYLHSLQVGAGEEEEPTESDSLWYDCYKYVMIKDLPDKEIGSDAAEENPKRGRVEHTRTTLRSTLPATYTVNSPKEARVLAYAREFQRTFGELYPHRRPLFLMPENEAGVPKLVCTTLRPTEMPYHKLYEYQSAAHFVSEFIKYEPLENPVKFPSCLPSPLTVINWQAGDCFDMSVLLASILLGVGYNAYVVAGYAPKDVTLNNQTHNICPLLKKDLERAGQPSATTVPAMPAAQEERSEMQRSTMGDGEPLSAEESHAGAELLGLEPSQVVKYQVKDFPDLKSHYQEAMQRRDEDKKVAKAAQQEAARVLEDEQRKAKEDELRRMEFAMEFGQEEEEAGDPHEGRRVHAWVLLLPKKRGVTAPLFIEPTTGECFAPEASPYEGVEFVWNHQNFWVCMQMPEPHSDSRAHPRDVQWDLSNPKLWEFLLSPFEDVLAEPEMYPGAQELAQRIQKAISSDVGLAAQPPGLGSVALGAVEAAVKAGGGEGVLAAAVRNPELWMEAVVSGEQLKDREGQVIDMPPSWVPRLVISRDAFDTRCPRGHKVVMYDRCKSEIFAYFGECAKAYEGRVERLTFFSDVQCTAKTEVWEFFQRRADKLKERREYVTEEPGGKKGEKVVEHFAEGSSSALKTHISIRGKYRETHYWTEARQDGLVKRVEEFIESEYTYLKWVVSQAFLPRRKTTEWFRGRDDRLEYRSVRYKDMSPEDMVSRQAGEAERTAAQDYMRTETHQGIIKITQKFSRDESVPAGQDVAKRRFCLDPKNDRIEVHYHYGEGKITRASKIFRKGDAEVSQVDPTAGPVSKSQLAEETLQLVQEEREAVTAVRDMEAEIREMMVRREEEESGGVHVPYYDIIRENQEESDAEGEDEEATEHDYLAPYLPPNYKPRKALSQQEAVQVRSRALDALKERVLRREAIIRGRLEEETAALQKKQATFQRDRDSMQRADEEQHEMEVEQALFKLHILDYRKKKHDEDALLKFFELDQKLKRDPRLANLLVPHHK